MRRRRNGRLHAGRSSLKAAALGAKKMAADPMFGRVRDLFGTETRGDNLADGIVGEQETAARLQREAMARRAGAKWRKHAANSGKTRGN